MKTIKHAITEHRKALAMVLMESAIGGAIQALGSVPSGDLYVQVMSHIDIHTYNAIIDALIERKQIKRDASHLLTWIGPKA